MHPQSQVFSRLREAMSEKHLTVRALHELSRVARGAISSLRTNDWDRVSRKALANLPPALGLTLNDLFVVYQKDIWLPIKLARETTIHFGFNTLPEAAQCPGGTDDENVLNRECVGSWDVRAFFVLWEYLSKLGVDIRVRFQAHVTGAERGVDPAIKDAVHRVFESGNHIVIGSPVANQFAEEVVCHAYGVAPYALKPNKAFPYHFVWDRRHETCSSFGTHRDNGAWGIASSRTGRLVAQRTFVRQGEGKDCALLVAHRIFQPRSKRDMGQDDERVVIVILGHSGPGTYGGAQVATDPNNASGLYPAKQGTPRMRVVAVDYLRPTPSRRDNREVTGAKLVQDGRTREPRKPASGRARAASKRAGRRRQRQ